MPAPHHFAQRHQLKLVSTPANQLKLVSTPANQLKVVSTPTNQLKLVSTPTWYGICMGGHTWEPKPRSQKKSMKIEKYEDRKVEILWGKEGVRGSRTTVAMRESMWCRAWRSAPGIAKRFLNLQRPPNVRERSEMNACCKSDQQIKKQTKESNCSPNHNLLLVCSLCHNPTKHWVIGDGRCGQTWGDAMVGQWNCKGQKHTNPTKHWVKSIPTQTRYSSTTTRHRTCRGGKGHANKHVVAFRKAPQEMWLLSERCHK